MRVWGRRSLAKCRLSVCGTSPHIWSERGVFCWQTKGRHARMVEDVRRPRRAEHATPHPKNSEGSCKMLRQSLERHPIPLCWQALTTEGHLYVKINAVNKSEWWRDLGECQKLHVCALYWEAAAVGSAFVFCVISAPAFVFWLERRYFAMRGSAGRFCHLVSGLNHFRIFCSTFQAENCGSPDNTGWNKPRFLFSGGKKIYNSSDIHVSYCRYP